jgi:4-amino-4-deoxy-L-arabinose transferase-like glycosyltransferase
MNNSPSPCRIFLAVAFFCIIYAVVAWTATSGKSATADEPTHAVTGWFDLWRADFRLCPDMPPLWEDLIALPIGPAAIRYDLSKPEFQDYFTIRNRHETLPWDVRMLYRTSGNDGVEIVRRARITALILAVGLAAMVAHWAWKLGGAVAAIAAAFVYCLDPSFLGHGALAKNDVGISLAFLAVAYAMWRCGRRLTWANAAAVAILVSAAILTKYSGLMLVPILMGMLVIRALDGETWIVLGKTLSTRSRKSFAATGLFLATCAVSYLAIWAIYDFRFNSGPDGLTLDMSRFLTSLRNDQVYVQTHGRPTPAQLAEWTPPLSTQLVMYAEAHHLLPQAWAAGFIMTQSGLNARLCYLNGEFFNGGKWYYFPLAMFYKAPLATILAAFVSALFGIRFIRSGALRSWQTRWNAIALLLPASVYAVSAMTSNVDIGVRLVFPIYVFAFIGIGLAAARAWQTGSAARLAILLLAVGLLAETTVAYPNYINFFGIACGGESAGFGLLSDSNLDWAQDLPALANWQKQNPGVALYLEFSGRADPEAYGVHYHNLPGGYAYGPPPEMPRQPCVVAIGATPLAAAYHWPPVWFDFIRDRKPMAVLNGTIYLYDLRGQ